MSWPISKRQGSPVPGEFRVSRTSTTSPFQLQLSTILCFGSLSLPVLALVDSGAEECLIDRSLTQQLDIPTVPLEPSLEARALNGLRLAHVTCKTVPITLVVAGNHQEKLSFCVIDRSEPPLVLGYPWLLSHNPQLDWKKGEFNHGVPPAINDASDLPSLL